MKVNIEYILWLKSELQKINIAQLKDIELFKDEKRVVLTQDQIDFIEDTGLNNTDIVSYIFDEWD